MRVESAFVYLIEVDSHTRGTVVEGSVKADVLHRVLYPQVHDNGILKKSAFVRTMNLISRELCFLTNFLYSLDVHSHINCK
jgi:hypothetical protein